MKDNLDEFIKNECSKCQNKNKMDCNIVKRMDGKYDCTNKKV